MFELLLDCPICGRRGYAVRDLQAHFCHGKHGSDFKVRRLTDEEINIAIATSAVKSLPDFRLVKWNSTVEKPHGRVPVLFCGDGMLEDTGRRVRTIGVGSWDGQCFRDYFGKELHPSIFTHWTVFPEPHKGFLPGSN